MPFLFNIQIIAINTTRETLPILSNTGVNVSTHNISFEARTVNQIKFGIIINKNNSSTKISNPILYFFNITIPTIFNLSFTIFHKSLPPK